MTDYDQPRDNSRDLTMRNGAPQLVQLELIKSD